MFIVWNIDSHDAKIDYTSAARGSVWTQSLPEIVGGFQYTEGQVRDLHVNGSGIPLYVE